MIHSEWKLATKLELVPGGILLGTLGALGRNNLLIGMRHISIFVAYGRLENPHPCLSIFMVFINLVYMKIHNWIFPKVRGTSLFASCQMAFAHIWRII